MLAWVVLIVLLLGAIQSDGSAIFFPYLMLFSVRRFPRKNRSP